MSVSPTQNFSNPPPVPAWPTLISTSGFSPLNCSATAWVSGPTVLDPLILIEPERPLAPPLLLLAVLSSSELPHPATPRAITPQQEMASIDLRGITWFGLLRLFVEETLPALTGPAVTGRWRICEEVVKRLVPEDALALDGLDGARLPDGVVGGLGSQRLRVEAVTDAEMRVDVLPAR